MGSEKTENGLFQVGYLKKRHISGGVFIKRRPISGGLLKTLWQPCVYCISCPYHDHQSIPYCPKPHNAGDSIWPYLNCCCAVQIMIIYVDISLHLFNVRNMFLNVPFFLLQVDNIKYLICADCEIGPIGWHCVQDKTAYYIAVDRVKHG